MVDYDHGTDTRNGVETVDAPQSSGIDAAAGVADDGGFCAWSVVGRGRFIRLEWERSEGEKEREKEREKEKRIDRTSGL